MATETKITKHGWPGFLAFRANATWEVDEDAKARPTPDLMGILNQIVGYDLFETGQVEADRDLYLRATSRVGQDGKVVPAEDVLGDLDSEE